MTLDRTKFRATSMQKIKEQEEEFEKVAPKQTITKNYAGWLTITKGTNKLRIMPAHKESTTFIYPRTVSWINKEMQVDDGKGGKKTEIKRGPVFNARVHSAFREKDIIEEYVRIATEMLKDQISDETILAKQLSKMTYWETGILPKSDWVCYAQKYENGKKEMGLLALSYSMKEQLNNLAAIEDSSEVIQTDPFTDPDDGKAVIITKNVETVKTKGGGSREKTSYTAAIEFRGDYRLSDEELLELDGFESLETLYKNSYTKRDFETALKGLQIFDNEHDFYVFDNEEFQQVIDELKDLYPEPAQSSDTDEEQDEDLDSMSRAELKAFIQKNNLTVKPKPGMTDEELVALIKKEINSSSDVQEEEKTDIDEILDRKPGAVAKKSSALDDVKKKLGAKK